MAQVTRGGGGEPAGQAHGVGAVGQLPGPVGAVVGVLAGGAVFRLFRDEAPQRRKGTVGVRLPALGQGGVDVGHPGGDEMGGVTVHQAVMGLLVPVIAVRGDAEERLCEAGPLLQVVDAGHVGAHPAPRRRGRVGLRADVGEVQRPVPERLDGLAHAVLVPRQAQPVGVALGDHAA